MRLVTTRRVNTHSQPRWGTTCGFVLILLFAACTSPARSPNGPFAATAGLYVDPTSSAKKWVTRHPDDPRADIIARNIASKPMAKWFAGTASAVTADVDRYVSAAAAVGRLPVLVAYNIPRRDCGGDSAGGLSTSAEYRAWIRAFAAGLGDRPALVVLEPDALLLLDCLSRSDARQRIALLADALSVLRTDAPGTWTYLDAGDGSATPVETMADRLTWTGVATARGIALNVSNFNRVEDVVSYGNRLRALLDPDQASGGTAPPALLIDVSRSGSGPGDSYCNPPGRRLGADPKPGGTLLGVDALLWVKPPGESDGNCGIGLGTQSGDFVPGLAMALIDGSA